MERQSIFFEDAKADYDEQRQLVENKRNYDLLIKRANVAMMEKLLENGHKGSFDDVLLPYAFKRLKEEMQELEDACNVRDIRREAADVMNFAAMIIYTCDEVIEGAKHD